MLKISFSETLSKENLTAKDQGSVFNRLAGFLFSAGIAVCTLYIGTQCIASSVYFKNVFEQITTKSKSSVLNRLAGFFFAAAMVVFITLMGVTRAKAQNATVTGSVPSGPASDQVLRLSLRDAIDMALKCNLGAVESGENVRIARGQRLLALSNLLPQVSLGASENVEQMNLANVGINKVKLSGIPNVIGTIQL